VRLAVRTALDGTPFLRRWLEITNVSDRPLPLASISPFAGSIWTVVGPSEIVAPGRPVFEVGAFRSDGWGREGAFAWSPLHAGTFELAGRRGHSGWGRPTMFIRNHVTGEIAVVDLAWSGNWVLRASHTPVEGPDDPRPAYEAVLSVEAGPTANAPQRVVAPNETVATPAVHVANLQGNLDDAVQALHEHVRRSVLPAPRQGRDQRVEANHFGFVRDRLDIGFLKRDIDVAASVGCEMYVLDAGWFGHQFGHWWTSVGDWEAGPWLEGGVEAVSEHVRGLGMQFGLWLEIECVGSRSRLFRDHPDWLLLRDGQPVGEQRPDGGHYLLDLTLPDVAAWAEAELVRVVDRYRLDLLKLDMNIDLWAGGERDRDGFIENTLWRHYEALYAILERLRGRFPDLIVQNCTGGGGRTDLGIMRYADTTLLSDWVRLPRGLLILNGMSLVLPPEVCNRIAGWLSSSQEHYGDLDTQLRVAMLGHPTLFGIAPSVDELPPAHRERLEHAIRLYQDTIRPLLRTCRVYHHTPVIDFERPTGFCVLEYAAPDRSRSVVGVFRLAGDTDSIPVQPRGLDRGRSYRVRLDSADTEFEATGADLVDRGISLRLEQPLTSELVLVLPVET
jgi:alpha-galactosidase